MFIFFRHYRFSFQIKKLNKTKKNENQFNGKLKKKKIIKI
jgi:hypothetical protein